VRTKSDARMSSTEASYVENQSGWTLLVFSLCCAAIVGISFRIFFSSQEITSRVRQALDRQSGTYQIQFKAAHLQLARGAFPQLAVLIEETAFTSLRQCEKKPSVTIGQITVPLEFWTFVLSGFQKVRIGEVHGENVTIDLDRLRSSGATCQSSAERVIEKKTSPVVATLPSADRAQPAVSSDTAAAAPHISAAAQPWWDEHQIHALRELMTRLEFKNVELTFETRRRASETIAKHIQLEEFSLDLGAADEDVRLQTFVQLPPEMTFGEKLPRFGLQASAKANSALVKVKADLSEGNLEGTASLRPAIDAGLEIDARAVVAELPLSMTVPLLEKAGLIRPGLTPRFLWLGCSAHLSGRFQGIFQHEPLHLENCVIQGSGGEIKLAAAERRPSGIWSPFEVQINNLDLRSVAQMFHLRGPDGIASDFGQLTGTLDVKSANEARFSGLLLGSQMHFSSRNLRAVQTVSKMALKLTVNGARMSGLIDTIDLKDGSFNGSLEFISDREFREGRVKIHLTDLTFAPVVQNVLFDGALSPLRGDGQAVISEGRLASVGGDWFIDQLNARDVQMKNAHIRTAYDGSDVELTLKAPVVALNQNSKTFSLWRPLFFAHQFSEPWVPMADVQCRAVISEKQGLKWQKIEGSFENNRISIQSAGSMSRDHELSGFILMDFPKLKHLRWHLSGVDTQPHLQLTPASLAELSSMNATAENADDQVLGLSTQNEQ
jgi:hypothetical protein